MPGEDASSGRIPMSYRYGEIRSPYIDALEPLDVQDRHFLDCVANKLVPTTDGANGEAVVRVLECADISLREGRAVDVHEPVTPVNGRAHLARASDGRDEAAERDPYLRSVPGLTAMSREVGEELDLVWSEVTASSSFIGGPLVERFERDWAAFCGRDTAVGVANGTDAIELTLRALGIGPGDEVMVPANTSSRPPRAWSWPAPLLGSRTWTRIAARHSRHPRCRGHT